MSSPVLMEVPVDEGYEVFESVQLKEQEDTEDNQVYMLGGPLDGEPITSDKKLLWVVVATKSKGLIALYEKQGNRYVYRKTIEGYPEKKKSYSNLITANIVRTSEPVNWQEAHWRVWTTGSEINCEF